MSDARLIASMPFSSKVIHSLSVSGYRTVEDLVGVLPIDLQEECKLSSHEAIDVISKVQQLAPESSSTSSAGLGQTLKDMMTKFTNEVPIITFCKALDGILGGGVQIGQITEFCGVPGIGKTQLAIQLALNVQIPRDLYNGCGGQALYIDTEGSFMIERVFEIATALSRHLTNLAVAKIPSTVDTSSSTSNMSSLIKKRQEILDNVSVDRLLSGIHVSRVHDQTEFLAVINQLDAFIRSNSAVKIVLIDSIAFPFRQALQDSFTRTRMLASIAQTLNALADRWKLSIVVMNHVTTKIETRQDNQSISRIIPALGDQWSHCIANRVLLHWGTTIIDKNSSGEDIEASRAPYEKVRVAALLKSPSKPNTSVNYQVNELGIRDVAYGLQVRIIHSNNINPDLYCVHNSPKTPIKDRN